MRLTVGLVSWTGKHLNMCCRFSYFGWYYVPYLGGRAQTLRWTGSWTASRWRSLRAQCTITWSSNMENPSALLTEHWCVPCLLEMLSNNISHSLQDVYCKITFLGSIRNCSHPFLSGGCGADGLFNLRSTSLLRLQRKIQTISDFIVRMLVINACSTSPSRAKLHVFQSSLEANLDMWVDKYGPFRERSYSLPFS